MSVDGVPVGSGVHFVWRTMHWKESKEYQIGFEIRDYRRNYLEIISVPKEFLVAIIKAMALQENLGYAYVKQDKVTYFSGELERKNR